jgi:hypothetical protein
MRGRILVTFRGERPVGDLRVTGYPTATGRRGAAEEQRT